MRLPPLLLLLLPALAQAQPSQPPEQPQAKALYEQGVSAADRKDWAAARIAFLKAWDLFQHYEIAANLAKAEFELNRYRDAAEHLDFALKNAPDDLPAEDRRSIQEMFAQARSHIGELLIDVNVNGADIFVDHSSVGKAPLGRSLFVEPGARLLEARLDGYPSVHQSVNIETGSAQWTVRLTLEKLPVPVKESSGPHKMLMIAGWSAVSAGMIVTAVSAGFAVHYDSQITDHYQKYNNNCMAYPKGYSNCVPDYNDRRKQGTLSANIAVNAGIITGAGMLGMLIYTFWPREPTEQREAKPATIDIYVGSGAAGGAVSIPW